MKDFTVLWDIINRWNAGTQSEKIKIRVRTIDGRTEINLLFNKKKLTFSDLAENRENVEMEVINYIFKSAFQGLDANCN